MFDRSRRHPKFMFSKTHPSAKMFLFALRFSKTIGGSATLRPTGFNFTNEWYQDT